MSRLAKFKNQSDLAQTFTINNMKEGFYIADDCDIWDRGTIIYRDYDGNLHAFGKGYLVLKNVNRYSYSGKFLRIPDDVEIIVSN